MKKMDSMRKSTVLPKLLCIVLCIICSALLGNAQQLSLTSSNYNGYNISCFGWRNGSIDLTITGGTPPYAILWSNGQTTEDISILPAGYYHVFVEDADPLTPQSEAEITLVEPRALSMEANPYIQMDSI